MFIKHKHTKSYEVHSHTQLQLNINYFLYSFHTFYCRIGVTSCVAWVMLRTTSTQTVIKLLLLGNFSAANMHIQFICDPFCTVFFNRHCICNIINMWEISSVTGVSAHSVAMQSIHTACRSNSCNHTCN